MLLKDYFDAGRTLAWGNDLTPHQMDAMDAGEVFTLVAADGITPHARLLRDSYGAIREEVIGGCETAGGEVETRDCRCGTGR